MTAQRSGARAEPPNAATESTAAQAARSTPTVPPAAPSEPDNGLGTPHPLGELLHRLRFRKSDRISVCSKRSPRAPFEAKFVTVANVGNVVGRFAHRDTWFATAPLNRTVKNGRGKAKDVVGIRVVFADLDHEPDKARDEATSRAIIAGISERLGTPPTAIVMTSNGLHPYWPVEQDSDTSWSDGDDPRRTRAASVLDNFGDLVREVAAEQGATVDAVFDPPRVMRAPGTTNRKDPKAPIPTTVEYPEGGRPLTLAEIEAVCATVAPAEPVAKARAPRAAKVRRRAPAPSTGGMFSAPADDEPDGLTPYTAGGRRAVLANLDALAAKPWTPGADWDATTYREGCNLLELSNGDPAYPREQARADLHAHAPRDDEWGTDQHEEKWRSAVATVGDKTREPSTPTPSPCPRSLDQVRATYLRWMGEDYDLGALEVVLATAAVEQLGGDPVWLLMVSGSGAAKTETVAPLAGAGAHVTSTITSEGALLSATSKKETAKDATGGLLRKIGPRGLLVIKDFTSILSMNRDQRAAVLAALREVYDGKWERNVGTDGGRTLTWAGRIVLVGAVTTAYDSAHAVIASMGDRFALVRVDSHLGRRTSGRQALRNVDHEVEMRAELAEVTGGLLASLRPELAVLSEEDMEELLGLADLVTLARTAVERDYRGEVVEAHAPEMPTRFAKMLGQVVRGGLAIGMTHHDALASARRVARDSMPPLRLAALTDVAAHPGARTSEVTKRVQKPRSTVDRVLQELHALGLLEVDDADQAGLVGARGWQYRLSGAVDPEVLAQLITRNVSTPGVRVKEESSQKDSCPESRPYLGTDISGDAPPTASWLAPPAAVPAGRGA